MQIVDRKTLPWFIGFLVALAVAIGAYIPYVQRHPAGPSGGSWPGLVYGIVGSLLILIALLLGLRKQFRTVRLGRAYLWMQAHIWLGSLSYPIILCHAGFRWGGPLTQVLMWVYTLVMLTGILGLALQQFVPGKLKREVPRETVFGQIEHVINQLKIESDALVCAVERGVRRPSRENPGALPYIGGGAALATVISSVSLPDDRQRLLLRSYYNEEVLPLLTQSATPRLKTRAWGAFDSRFSRIRAQFPSSLHQAMDDLHEIVLERAQLERQRSLHRLLHGWLLVHVPLSYAMVILALIHAVYAIKYSSI